MRVISVSLEFDDVTSIIDRSILAEIDCIFLFHGSVFLFNFVSLQNQRKCQTFYLFIHLYFVFCDDDDILLHNLPICIILFETRVFLCAASDKTMSIQHRMHVV